MGPPWYSGYATPPGLGDGCGQYPRAMGGSQGRQGGRQAPTLMSFVAGETDGCFTYG